jgi:hypothetical protein
MCFPQVFYPNVMIHHYHDWNESLVELRDHLQIQDKMRKKRKSNPTQKKKKKKNKSKLHLTHLKESFLPRTDKQKQHYMQVKKKKLSINL